MEKQIKKVWVPPIGPGFSFEIPIIEGEHTYEAKRNGDTVEYFIDGKKVNSESK